MGWRKGVEEGSGGEGRGRKGRGVDKSYTLCKVPSLCTSCTDKMSSCVRACVCVYRGKILALAIISSTLVFPALWSPTTTTFGN